MSNLGLDSFLVWLPFFIASSFFFLVSSFLLWRLAFLARGEIGVGGECMTQFFTSIVTFIFFSHFAPAYFFFYLPFSLLFDDVEDLEIGRGAVLYLPSLGIYYCMEWSQSSLDSPKNHVVISLQCQTYQKSFSSVLLAQIVSASDTSSSTEVIWIFNESLWSLACSVSRVQLDFQGASVEFDEMDARFRAG
jgi:hypothetical protein